MTDSAHPRHEHRHQTRGRRDTRRRRLGVVVLVALAGLLLNTVAVARQSGHATGNSTVAVNGGQMYVRQDGPRNRSALVLIHGLAGSTRWWDSVVPSLATSHRVIRVDLLGHGRSAKPGDGDYGIVDQARRVGAVLDRLDVERAIVVGHSTGGCVATALATERPGLVAAVALLNSGPYLDAYRPEGLASRLIPMPVVGHLLWRLRTDGLLRKAMASGFSRPGYTIPQKLVDDASGITYRAFIETSRASTDYLAERPLPDRLAALGKPLLVVFGEADQRWRSSSAAAYRDVPGARVELLPGIGHSPMLEDPQRTGALLSEFAAAHAPHRR